MQQQLESLVETLADSWEQCSPSPGIHLIQTISQQRIPCTYLCTRQFMSCGTVLAICDVTRGNPSSALSLGSGPMGQLEAELCMPSELSAVCNLHRLHRLVHPVCVDLLDLFDHIHPLNNLAKDHCIMTFSQCTAKHSSICFQRSQHQRPLSVTDSKHAPCFPSR